MSGFPSLLSYSQNMWLCIQQVYIVPCQSLACCAAQPCFLHFISVFFLGVEAVLASHTGTVSGDLLPTVVNVETALHSVITGCSRLILCF